MGNVSIVVDAETGKAVQGILKIMDGMKGMEGAAKKGGREISITGRLLDRMGLQGKTATERLVNGFTGLVGPMIAVSAAAAVISKAMAEIEKTGEDARRVIDSVTQSGKRLVQVSSSPEELKQLRALATGLSKEHGLTAANAEDLVFQAKSAGMLQDVQLFAQSQQFTDPIQAMMAAQKFKEAFGAKEVGTSREVLSKVLEAAKVSDVSFEKLAPASIAAAGSVSAVKGGDEDLLATLAALSAGGKSPEEVAMRIKAFSSVLLKTAGSGGKKGFGSKGGKDLSKLGLVGGLEAVMGMSEDEQRELLSGNQEALLLFEQFKVKGGDVKSLRDQLLKVQGGGDDDAFGRALGIAQSDVELESVRGAEQGKALLDEANRQFGPEEKKKQALIDIKRQERIEKYGRYAGPAIHGFQETAADIQTFFSDFVPWSSDPRLKEIEQRESEHGGSLTDELKKLRESNEKLIETLAAPGRGGVDSHSE